MSEAVDLTRRRTAYGIGLAVMLAVFGARAIYILSYGSPTPFFDQWDAEGDHLLRPWIDGTMRAQDWFAPHNEHRIVWSRILSITIFESTGSWDNRNLALASSSVASFIAALLASMSWRSLESTTARLTITALLVALFGLPFSWENILVGFQSQFYFMALFGVAVIMVVTRDDRPGTYVASIALALGSIFSMASGLVGVVAAGAAKAFSMVSRRQFSWSGASLIILLAWISLTALRAVPEIPQHEALRAQSILQLFHATAVALSWPFTGYVWVAIPLWIPFFIASALGALGRPLKSTDVAAWGIAAMVFGQAIAMAYSRGEGMEQVPSRYTDILALGVFANSFLAFRIAEEHLPTAMLRYGGQALVATGVLALLFAFGFRSSSDLEAMRGRSALTCDHQTMLKSFFADGDPSIFNAPPQALPYPDVGRLVVLASDSTLRTLLAPGVEPKEMTRCFQPSDEVTEGDYGIPDAIVVPFGRVGIDGQVLALASGEVLDVVVEATLDGQLSGAGLLVGTFRGSSNGVLALTACQKGRCSTGSVDLARTPDNTFARLRLDSPLELTSDERLTLRWQTTGATHPLGVWNYAATTPPAEIVGLEGAKNRTVAIELVVLPE